MISGIEPVELVWDGFLKNLKRQDTPSRVFYYEYGVAEKIKKPLDDKYDI